MDDKPKFDLNDVTRQDGDDAVRARLDRAKRHKVKTAAMTLDQWLSRDLPTPDAILGNWLSTTSRVLLVAPTGVGKSMFCIALGIAIAAANGFLHWRGVRPARVLFVDGEMSRRLLKCRLADEAARSDARPTTFHALNHEDVENFSPLNTKEGQAIIDAEIKRIGGADLVIFDNVMSLISGNQREEEGWTNTMPWVRGLTRQHIAQMWVHHANDEGKVYGAKIREWQMDTVIIFEPIERADTDVSFSLTFRKARERTPDTRKEFATVNVALVNSRWMVETNGSAKGKRLKDARAELARRSLANALCGGLRAEYLPGQPIIVTIDQWRAQAFKEGFAAELAPDSRKKAFQRAREALQLAGIIGIENELVWLAQQTT